MLAMQVGPHMRRISRNRRMSCRRASSARHTSATGAAHSSCLIVEPPSLRPEQFVSQLTPAWAADGKRAQGRKSMDGRAQALCARPGTAGQRRRARWRRRSRGLGSIRFPPRWDATPAPAIAAPRSPEWDDRNVRPGPSALPGCLIDRLDGRGARDSPGRGRMRGSSMTSEGSSAPLVSGRRGRLG